MEVLRSFIGDHKTLLSWKMDGLTVVLTYRGGTLAKAVTRGNGVIGEVVTNNAKVFENIPLKIPYQGELVLRGEAIIRYSDFEKINEELRQYSPDLAARPMIVAANKADLLPPDSDNLERLKAHVEAQGYEFFELSAATTAGTKELMQRAAAMLSTLPPIAVYEPDYVPPAPDLGSPEDVEIEEDDGVWYVSGPWMDRLVSTVNFTDYESRMYFDKSLRDAGIYERMEALGIRDGDTISICGMTFEYKS